MSFRLDPEGRYTRQAIHIGGVRAGSTPEIIRTVLGSCIAVCLHDPISRVGGMNHFMLPFGFGDGAECPRYGVHAMELLINACMKAGASRSALRAKVVGGGHVLNIARSEGNVPESNIRFADQFLQAENIPVLARDVGGRSAREVYFFTDTARVLVKYVSTPERDTTSDRSLAKMEREERRRARRIARDLQIDAMENRNVELF